MNSRKEIDNMDVSLKNRAKKLLVGMELEFTCESCGKAVTAELEKNLVLHCPECGAKRKVNMDDIVKTDLNQMV